MMCRVVHEFVMHSECAVSVCQCKCFCDRNAGFLEGSDSDSRVRVRSQV